MQAAKISAHRADKPGVGLEAAFAETADPGAYVPRAASDLALADLENRIVAERGSAWLSAPPGMGKTMVMHVLAARLAAAGLRCQYLPYGALAPEELCTWALGLLGERPVQGEASMSTLVRFAAELRERGGALVLMIDDADSIPLPTARALADLESRCELSLRLVMAASDDAQASRVLAAFGDAVAETRLCQPLSPREAEAYVQTRIRSSPEADPLLERFDEETVGRIHRLSGGNPRRIHELAIGLLQGRGFAGLGWREAAKKETPRLVALVAGLDRASNVEPELDRGPDQPDGPATPPESMLAPRADLASAPASESAPRLQGEMEREVEPGAHVESPVHSAREPAVGEDVQPSMPAMDAAHEGEVVDSAPPDPAEAVGRKPQPPIGEPESERPMAGEALAASQAPKPPPSESAAGPEVQTSAPVEEASEDTEEPAPIDFARQLRAKLAAARAPESPHDEDRGAAPRRAASNEARDARDTKTEETTRRPSRIEEILATHAVDPKASHAPKSESVLAPERECESISEPDLAAETETTPAPSVATDVRSDAESTASVEPAHHQQPIEAEAQPPTPETSSEEGADPEAHDAQPESEAPESDALSTPERPGVRPVHPSTARARRRRRRR